MGQITKVTPDMIQVANNVTSKTVGNTTSGISLTFDSNGVITSAANVTLSVANTQLTGTINSAQIASNTISNTNIATGAVENYLRANALDFGMRNRIINGAMAIDQRNAGASVSVSTSGVYVLDRWKNRASGGGVFTVQQSSTAPAGFNTSALYTVTTADSSIAAGDNYWIIQDIEGFNVADLLWGTANARPITISFWVRSSVTGTFNVGLTNGTTYDRSYVSTYTINSANTFEYKTVTIAGDTTGTWGKTNGGGISLVFNLGAGTDYQATANTWVAGFEQSTSGSTNWIATNGATFYITGVQLEEGSTATSFEYRQYGTELKLCERYYEVMQQASIIGCADGSNVILCPYTYRTIKRATPSLTLLTTTVTVTEPTVASRTSSGSTLGAGTGASTQSCIYQIFGFSSLTNQNVVMGGNAANVPVLAISSEL